MPRVCTVCRHPERVEIDRALVAGAAHLPLSKQYGLSGSAVRRHFQTCLPAAMVQAQAAEDVRQAIDVVKQLKAINGVCFQVLGDARRSGDGELVLKAVDRIHKQLELQARLIEQLEQRERERSDEGEGSGRVMIREIVAILPEGSRRDRIIDV